MDTSKNVSSSLRDHCSQGIRGEHDWLLRNCLHNVCFVLAAVFAVIAGFDVWGEGQNHSTLLKLTGLGTTVVFLCLGWLLSQKPVPIRFLNLLLVCISAGVLLNLGAREYLLPSMINIPYFVMYGGLLGLFFLSTRWYLGTLVGAVACSWIALMPGMLPGDLSKVILVLCITILYSVALHLFRTRIFIRMKQLLMDDKKRIAELKAVVIRSEENEHKYRIVSKAVPIGIFQVNGDGFCEHTNNNWHTLCIAAGVLKMEHRWTDILCDSVREAAFESWQNAIENRSCFKGVYRQQTGTADVRWLEISISSVFNDDGMMFVGTAEDITEKKQIHDQLRQTADELRSSKNAQDAYAQQLEIVVEELEIAKLKAEDSAQAKSDFLANMSHEIRTPITAILGFTEITLDETPEGTHTSESLKTIKRNSEHLLQVINDILDISKIEAGKLDVELMPCQPKEIIDEVLEQSAVKAKESQLSLEVIYEGLIPETITTDPTHLRQILMNLLSNAIKFTKTGGIRVKVKFNNADAEHEQPRLEVSVIDTGIGMTQTQIANLFQPFTQADNSTSRQFGGTGLGLSISKRLAKNLGGDVYVQSQSGQGSTFHMVIATGDVSGVKMLDHSLPSPLTTLVRPSPAEAPSNKTSKQDERLDCNLLLVEDGEDNQRLISFLMKKAGAQVTVAENGLAGIAKVNLAIKEGQPFDIILMDMQMPLMDGYTATKELRKQGTKTPIIALTAHAMAGDREKCIQAGCRDYATKPINRSKLIGMINAALNDTVPALPLEG